MGVLDNLHRSDRILVAGQPWHSQASIVGATNSVHLGILDGTKRSLRSQSRSLRASLVVAEESPKLLGLTGSLHSAGAKRSLDTLCHDPIHFGEVAMLELEALERQRHTEEDGGLIAHATAREDADAHTLRHRIKEVQHRELSHAVAELLWLKVIHSFQKLNISLAPSLRGSTEAAFGHVDLKRLALSLYSKDAVELVKEHVISIIGAWDHMDRKYQVQLALFQVQQIYSSSMAFGYALRRADARYQLDRVTGSLKGVDSLRNYIASLQPEEAQQMKTVISEEAGAVLDWQAFMMFGNFQHLRERFQESFKVVSDGIEPIAALQEAIQVGSVESIRISIGDLRRLALEGTAFGLLLGSSEAEIDTVYQLTPSKGNCLLAFLGDCSDEGHRLIESRLFKALGF